MADHRSVVQFYGRVNELRVDSLHREQVEIRMMEHYCRLGELEICTLVRQLCVWLQEKGPSDRAQMLISQVALLTEGMDTEQLDDLEREIVADRMEEQNGAG